MNSTPIIYISNTNIPSTKANTYQSLLMAEALANICPNIKFMYRAEKKIDDLTLINEIQEKYSIRIKFKLIGMRSCDIKLVKFLSEKYWNYIRAITFSISVLAYFFRYRINEHIVYSRDQFSCTALLIYKIAFFKKFKIIFEAHDVNKSISKLARYFDGIVCIADTLLPYYSGSKKLIVLGDASRKSDIAKFDDFNINYIGPIKILYVGNLYPWKGVYTILDSMNYLPAGYEIHIAGGSKELRSEFLSRIPKNTKSKLIYHGHVGASYVRDLIKSSDCCLIPNENESKNNHTSPMKAFEYMASAKSIISSDLPILKKLFLNNAIYFIAGNAKDLAKAIGTLNGRVGMKNMAVGLRQLAMDNTWDIRAERLMSWMRVDN